MSREKQIEEMAKIIDDNHGFIVSSVETAEALYNAGYRKQSDGEWRDRGNAKIENVKFPIVECSECHITFCDLLNNHYSMYRYCPYCGAKMKGGE